METFGQTVKRLRKAQRITQLELADKIGIDFTYVSKLKTTVHSGLLQNRP